ncbi:MAG TPA: type II toxin-antitoxin system death-on-curing family toxin [Pyrinomonadaceae bacterium]|nr:type II toxin-antitoxin system death-on-curing family toxin [Pyrinomonadaceae bacterium]
MNSEITWVLRDAVIAIHGRQIAEHGGSDGVRDQGLLLSALARPENLYDQSDNRDLAALAAAYAFGIAKSHPFMDGNKRTALVVARTFLKINGADMSASQDEKYTTFLKLAQGALSEEELAEWIRNKLV